MSLQRSHVLGLRPRACEGTEWIRRKGGHWFSEPEELCVTQETVHRASVRQRDTTLTWNRSCLQSRYICHWKTMFRNTKPLFILLDVCWCVCVCVRRWNLCIRMWVFARLMFQLLYKTVYMSVCLFPSVLLTLRMCVHRDENKKYI